MKMKKKLTTLVSCVVILGFAAAAELEGKGNVTVFSLKE